ncbi:DUF3320 domain-containing protein [Sphaerimonospora thailandensis]|nr:DUF3320 domain-containing protein [Sphaerimonospora thailandensis]
MKSSDDRLKLALKRWRDSLIDLSGKNRLLSFKHSRSATLEITSPEAAQLLAGLAKGLRFADLDEAAEDDEQGEPKAIAPAATACSGEIFTQKGTRSSLDSALRKLLRDSKQVFSDTGLWVLRLGVGFLDWSEDGGAKVCSAPLLLVPVALEHKTNGFHLLEVGDEEVTPNPAIAVKMERLGVEWPSADQMEDLPSTLAVVRRAVAGQRGWAVSERVVLATFQSHKETMYRDLLDNEERILANPLVHAVGLGPDAESDLSGLDFAPVPERELDRVQPPEDVPLVLDADSSQRQCLAAAVQGRTFVMDGPPGTGKSQTIANMIAVLLHAGRTVLFVSEKAAALDVVRNRLAGAGLEPFLLPLHSHHTSRKHVAQELGRALNEQPRARITAPARGRARSLRLGLSKYAEAMNEVREPLGRTLFGVIGRLNGLNDVVSLVPDRRFQAKELTSGHCDEILAAAREVSRAWRPVEEGDAFLWRGLERVESLRPSLDRVAEKTDLLRRAIERHGELALPLGLDDLPAVPKLISLLDLTASRPTVPPHWLSEPDLTPILTRLSDFEARRDQLIAVEQSAEREIGRSWGSLPRELAAHVPVDELALTNRSVPGVEVAALTAQQATKTAQDFAAIAAMLRRHRTSLADIAAMYGVPDPRDFNEAVNLCELVGFSGAEPKPEADWLDAQLRDAARHAAQELENALTELNRARGQANDLFNENIRTSPDLLVLAQRFAEDYHVFSKLSAAYRRDKKTLAELTHASAWSKAIAERLPEAVAWRQADERFHAAAREHAGRLGGFWAGEKTDFNNIRTALSLAEQIDAAAGAIRNNELLAAQVARNGMPSSIAIETAAVIRQDLSRWRASLVPAPHPGGRPALAQATLVEAAEWYEVHIPVLRATADMTRAVDMVSQSAPLTAARARHAIALVQEARRERAVFEGRQVADQALLGLLYQAECTDQPVIDAAVKWVGDARKMVPTGMPVESAESLLKATPDPDLAECYRSWVDSVGNMVTFWGEEQRETLRATLTGSFGEAAELIARMKADGSGPEEWRSLKQAREALAEHHLDDLIGRAAAQDVPGSRFGRLVERAVLQAWVECHLVADPRLAVSMAVQRDALVEEFRELDKELVVSAYARVIKACNARRPRTMLGPAAVINREAEKKTRHRPVRKLLSDAAETVHLIKPCFMMSPLTVSQFLPPDFQFDVVIFDEASQVRPHDAVNCIYRGRSLIVAGDQKQMPPTNFFGSSDEEDDEYDEEAPDSFDSLLDLCKASGVIRSLPLRWHYRSRHEHLIAFSNHEFYERGLVTFPGAFESGPGVGVRFHKVDGVYSRGVGRDNRIEADAVAKLVIDHFTTHPEQSLGVVAMSEPQARAIEEAVELARTGRPDLGRFFVEDRLDGFFVKNLETVQGDERDVIILSVGYGPDQHGKLSRNFGPLNKAGGWRRLNVAITRARYRVDLVASFTADSIPDSDNISYQHFKRYLEYAERGPAILAHQVVTEEADCESEFEESVAAVLRGWGYDVVPQVGVAGYRIDLGIRHPEMPGRYAIGIECDGPMYHSSPVARDRDRLRDQVLRGLGWELHRIWGSHWYWNRPEAEQRLRTAIEAAVDKVGATVAAPDPENLAIPSEHVARSKAEPKVEMEVVKENTERAWSTPYRKATVRLSPGDLPDMNLPEAQTQIRSLFSRIVDVEAPIHRDQLFLRARDAWGVGRIGGRIQANLEDVLDKMKRRKEVMVIGDFVFRSYGQVIARSPGNGAERKIMHIAPAEREVAILAIVGEAPGISESELIAEVSRFFGWRRRGAEITSTLRRDLQNLSKKGRISGDLDRITVIIK